MRSISVLSASTLASFFRIFSILSRCFSVKSPRCSRQSSVASASSAAPGLGVGGGAPTGGGAIRRRRRRRRRLCARLRLQRTRRFFLGHLLQRAEFSSLVAGESLLGMSLRAGDDERARGLAESDLVADEHGRVDARLELAAVDECAVGASGVVQEYLVAAFGELEHRVEARRGRVLEDHVVVGGAAEGEAAAPAAVDDVDDGAVLEHLEGEVRGREAAPLGLDVSAAGGRGRGRGGGIRRRGRWWRARLGTPARDTVVALGEQGAEAASPTSRPEPRGCARPRRSAGGGGIPIASLVDARETYWRGKEIAPSPRRANATPNRSRGSSSGGNGRELYGSMCRANLALHGSKVRGSTRAGTPAAAPARDEAAFRTSFATPLAALTRTTRRLATFGVETHSRRRSSRSGHLVSSS